MNFIIFFFFSTVLVLMIIFLKHELSKKHNIMDEIKTEQKTKLPCILCGAVLLKREKLKSEEFKSGNESLVNVFGCPYCYGPGSIKQRRCPVCGKKLSENQYLSGRMFYRDDRKPHLHINGCQNCRGK